MIELIAETGRTKTVALELPSWPGHLAGQHVDVRLTAADGYQAQRSYSIASAPEDDHLALTIERLDDGEVSPYLVDEVRPADELELRGPIGGYFVWQASLAGPLLMVAGGSGIVPFRAMLRHWDAAGRPVPVRLLLSARSLDDVIYREELLRLAAGDGLELRVALTRAWPQDWHGHRGRIDAELLRQVAWPSEDRPRTYVCGPSGFVEAAATHLVASGQPPSDIKTERFGPSGS